MTREHKIALILGFSLILLVAILISDHLSRARRTRVDEVQSSEVLLTEGSLTPTDPLAPLDPPAAARTQSTPVEPARAAGDSAPNPAPTANAAPGSSYHSESPLGGRALADKALHADVEAAGGTIVPGPVPVIVLPKTTNLGTRATDPAPTNPPEVTPLPPAESATRYHAVQKGDTLYRLAEKYYGSGRRWPVLADANKDRVGPNGMLREGTRLRIPNASTGTPTQEAPRSAPADAKPGKSTPSKATPGTRMAKAKTYTVRKDDTLSEISRRALGTSRRWREISELNGIDEEELLTPGMVLRLPG